MNNRYWGMYCPFHGLWLRDVRGGLLHYPAQEIAQAHLDEDRRVALLRPGHGLPNYSSGHLMEATEFGKERLIDQTQLKAGDAICHGAW